MSVNTNISNGSVLNVVVDGFDDEGRGRANVVVDGVEWDAAVRGAFPGDTGLVQIERVFATRNLVQARPVDEHFTRGPLFHRSECPHNGPCPACPTAALDDEVEYALKVARIEMALADVGIVLPVSDPIVAETRFFRRQRVRLAIHHDGKRIRLGHFIPHTDRFRSASGCVAARQSLRHTAHKMEDALSVVKSNSAAGALDELRHVTMREFREGVSVVAVFSAMPEDDTIHALNEIISRFSPAFRVRVDERGRNRSVGGATVFASGPPRLTPRFSVFDDDIDGFCQADAAVAELMYDRVADFLYDSEHSSYLDLYGGTGGFSRALLARGAKNVHLVESDHRGIPIALNDAVSVHQMTVEDFYTIDERARGFDAVVADPPQKGLGPVADTLVKHRPLRLALVSCDPDAMARDIVRLAVGFDVVDVVPVDLFPGTVDVEVITFLRAR